VAVQRANRYENQAKLALLLAVVGVLFALAEAAMFLVQFKPADFEARMGPRRSYAILAAVAAALGASTIGFFVALNSVHRLNPRPNLSWTGFFLNALALTIALCVFIVFWFSTEIVAPPRP